MALNHQYDYIILLCLFYVIPLRAASRSGRTLFQPRTGSWRLAVHPGLYRRLLHGSLFPVYLHDLSIPILFYPPMSWRREWQDPVPMATGQDPGLEGVKAFTLWQP